MADVVIVQQDSTPAADIVVVQQQVQSAAAELIVVQPNNPIPQSAEITVIQSSVPPTGETVQELKIVGPTPIIEKNLGGIEDLVMGAKVVLQLRNGKEVSITGLSAKSIPWTDLANEDGSLVSIYDYIEEQLHTTWDQQTIALSGTRYSQVMDVSEPYSVTVLDENGYKAYPAIAIRPDELVIESLIDLTGFFLVITKG